MSDDNDFATDGLYHGDRSIGCEIITFFVVGFWTFVCFIGLIIKTLMAGQ